MTVLGMTCLRMGGHRWSARKVAVAATFACCGLSMSAHAALFDDEEARRAIIDLREKSNSYQAAANDRLDTLSRSLIDLQGQLEQQRQEIARLRGQNEMLQNDLSMLKKGQLDGYRALDERLRKLEPQQIVVDGQEGLVQPTEKADYEVAFKAFRDGDYKAASAAFAAFQSRYPGSLYLPLVQYCQGSILYADRDYKAAISLLQNMVKAYPAHAKAPEALLMVANSQLESGQKSAGRKTLEQVRAQYADSEAARVAKDRLASLR